MFIITKRLNRTFLSLLLIFSGSMGLSGCAAMDEIDVSLPVVGNITKKLKKKEEKVAVRAPLVLPPSGTQGALPQPASANANSQEAWPDDPDLRAKRMAEAEAAKKKHYEEHGNLKNYQTMEEFNDAMDPMARRKGIFTKILGGE